MKTNDLDAPVLVEGCRSHKRGVSDHTEDDLESFEIVVASAKATARTVVRDHAGLQLRAQCHAQNPAVAGSFRDA